MLVVLNLISIPLVSIGLKHGLSAYRLLMARGDFRLRAAMVPTLNVAVYKELFLELASGHVTIVKRVR